MKISIITPCYNSEKYISEAIESVIFQRGEFEIEYVIVDGASNDGTMEIINRYVHKISNREIKVNCNKVEMKIISGPDQGMYDALVKGFKAVTGDIIGYINSDDYYLPNAFSAVNDIFGDNSNILWITGMGIRYNQIGQIINIFPLCRYDQSLIRKGFYGPILPFIQQESIFWRKELLAKLDYEKLNSYKYAGDYYIWNTFSKTTALFTVQSCFAGFRKRVDQLSENKCDYYREYYNIADKRNICDYIKACIYLMFTYLLPNRIKRALSMNIVYYVHGLKYWKRSRK